MTVNDQLNRPLSDVIRDILDLDTGAEAALILKSIFGAISKALLRDEKVTIKGFGTFKVVTRTHRPTPGNILMNYPRTRPGAVRATGLLTYQPRKIVVFKPSLPLMAMLNHDTPSHHERRTLQRWSKSARSGLGRTEGASNADRTPST